MENEGLWSKLNKEKHTFEVGKHLSLEEFKKAVSRVYPKEIDTSIEIPAAYLIYCTDAEFKAIYRNKNNYKIITGLENYNKIEARKKKLIK